MRTALSSHDRKVVNTPSKFPTRVLVLFLVLEYIRPPLLHQLRLPMAIVALMLIQWLGARNRPRSGILTAQVLFFVLCLQAIPYASNNYAAYITTRTMFSHVVIALSLSWVLTTHASFRTVTST